MKTELYTIAIGDAAHIEMSADQIRNAYAAKQLASATPVWRDGMAGWSTIQEMSDELGLQVVKNEPPPLQKKRIVKADKRHKICVSCGHVGKPASDIKGSFAVELVLWLLMLLPGFLYSLWRVTTRKQVCEVCGNDSIIPVTSPRGRELLEKAASE